MLIFSCIMDNNAMFAAQQAQYGKMYGSLEAAGAAAAAAAGRRGDDVGAHVGAGAAAGALGTQSTINTRLGVNHLHILYLNGLVVKGKAARKCLLFNKFSEKFVYFAFFQWFKFLGIPIFCL